MKTKICNKCGRELPLDSDHFYKNCGQKDGFTKICKECKGYHFTKYLTCKEGYMFCKKCDRELPYTVQYFPEDKKSTVLGLRKVCRECNQSYGRFLEDGELPKYKWSEEENQIFIKYFSQYTNSELRNLYFPNRTLRSIECHASEIGLLRKDKNQSVQDQIRESKSKKISQANTGKVMSEEFKRKISNIKIEYFKTHNSWIKGKTFSDATKKKMSEAKIKTGKWKGEDNPRHKNPLNGEKNGRWKGGILDTYIELRSETKDWFDESAKFCNYKCIITGGEFDNIHHTTAFRIIVDEVFENTGIEVRQKVCDYPEEEFSVLRKELKKLHNGYGFGACVNYDVHKLFHDNYGYTKFSPYDFLDFIYRIDVGEFDKWFSDHKLQININYDYVKYLESTLFDLKMSA